MNETIYIYYEECECFFFVVFEKKRREKKGYINKRILL